MKKLFYFVSLVCCFVLVFAQSQNPSVIALAAEPVTITSKAAILMDMDTKTVLYAHNENDQRQVASISKLMTILLTLEALEQGTLSLDQTIVASEEAAGMGGSQMFLDAHAQYKIADLLKGVIVASANDASVALAEAIAGSEQAFVIKMNERAKQLGLTKTHYANATGLSAANQFSTARDSAVLLSHVVPYELYQKDTAIWMEDFTHPSGRVTELVNTNRLSKYFQGSTGGKTGFTDEAQYCLAASAKRGNMQLVGVVLGASNAKTRFHEVGALLSYGFAAFEKTDVVSTASKLGTIAVVQSQTTEADVFASQNYSVLSKKGEKPNYELVLALDKRIAAPANAGAVVGQVKVLNQGEIVTEIDLIVKQDLVKITLAGAGKNIIARWK